MAATLLDVNVLVALFDAAHVHHDLAHDWFAGQRRRGWATCPVTEAGFLRVLSRPDYASGVGRLADLVQLLRKFCGSGGHEFWAEGVSLRDERLFNVALVRGPRQLTDVYLVGLARRQGGRLATFDRTIPWSAVRGAGRNLLEVISPSD